MTSVLQDWVQELSLMQQSVLLTTIRGPDGLNKNHVAKMIMRWIRRCVLLSAFDNSVLDNPWDERGGKFTGPSINIKVGESWTDAMDKVLKQYLDALDELPLHFHMHIIHTAEILGYKHPDEVIRRWWYRAYLNMVNDLHLHPESEERMDFRLGDSKPQWEKTTRVEQ